MMLFPKHQSKARLAALGLLLPLFLVVAATEPSFIGKIRNFSAYPDFYPPPNQGQKRSEIKGTEAQPLTNNLFLISGVKLDTFKIGGEKEISLQTPLCLYDARQKTVRSTNELLVSTADRKFALQGIGFYWQQTNSILVISNAVRTQVDPAVLEKSASEGQGSQDPVLIRSKSFDYSKETGSGRYSGAVEVTSSNLALACAELSFLMPFQEREMRQIDARGDVRMRHGEVHATGESASYDVPRGIATVKGSPRWKSPEQSGSADVVVINRPESLVEAIGNAKLRMAGRAVTDSPFSPPDKHKAQPGSTNRFVSIDSGTYRFWTNRAEFTQEVTVRDEVDSRVRSTLKSDSLKVSFAGKESFRDLEALGGVEIRQFGPQTNILETLAEFRSDRAWYAHSNSVLELTGSPAWISAGRRGSGDLIKINAQEEEMSVLGSAVMELPAGELTSEIHGLENPEASAPTNSKALIRSQNYHLNANGAVFEGGVSVQHPQVTWNCQTLSVVLPADGGKVQQMIAEENVRFTLKSQTGQTLTGTGRKAVYRVVPTPAGTNDFLELTGSPILTTSNGVFRGDIILLDVTNQRLIAPENYKIDAPELMSSTNVLRLPKKRLFR